MRFVDVTNDVAFRKIFGNENKTEILISFLNAVLNLTGRKKIKELAIINPYQLPRIKGEKATIIDVRAKDHTGQQFIIEMQVAEVRGFAKRVQYYTCRDYSMQIKIGDDYPKLKPTYFVGILDFNFFKGNKYITNHLILEEETLEHKLDDLKFTFIELPKFTLKENELKTLVEKWIFFIKNAENLDVVPDNTVDKGLLEAYRDAEMHRWDVEELKNYDNFFIAMQDARGRMELAIERAEKKGLERGIEKGIKQQTIQVIQNCLSQNLPLEVIATIAGVSLEEVKAVVDSLE